jgi:hypothetical protein
MIAVKRMSKGVLNVVPPVVLLLTLLAPSAQAMPEGRFIRHDERRQGFSQQSLDFQREVPVQFQRRDPGYPTDTQRSQRLSPEERRQLRRDIHEAGRDIYAPRR